MKCGCKIQWEPGHEWDDQFLTIAFCPLHAAAEELLEALKRAPEPVKGVGLAYLRDRLVAWYWGARKSAIAKATGGNHEQAK